jgi:hypothetical protein
MLLCWILDVSEDSFSVSIKDNRTVDELKNAIKKKKPVTVTNVDAFRLELWKVSVIVPLSLSQLQDKIGKRQFRDDDAALLKLLSDVFPRSECVQKTLHIVVRVPPARESSHCPSQVTP